MSREQLNDYEDRSKYEHLATFDSFRWIECLLRNAPGERSRQIKDILKP